MPLEYRIDQERRVVFATATGTLTDEDVFGYQRGVWSQSDVVGFDEVVDMGEVEDLVLSSGDRVRALADLASTMDVPGAASRLAIVAPQDFAFGLARMYEAYRTMNQRGSKVVSVFRSMQAALDWLGLESPGEPASGSPSGQGCRS